MEEDTTEDRTENPYRRRPYITAPTAVNVIGSSDEPTFVTGGAAVPTAPPLATGLEAERARLTAGKANIRSDKIDNSARNLITVGKGRGKVLPTTTQEEQFVGNNARNLITVGKGRGKVLPTIIQEEEFGSNNAIESTTEQCGKRPRGSGKVTIKNTAGRKKKGAKSPANLQDITDFLFNISE